MVVRSVVGIDVSLWTNLDRTLDTLFLRLYAKNLTRSFRAEPENACADTEIQLSTMLLLTIGALVLLFGTLLFPEYLLKALNGGNWTIAFLAVLTAIVAYSVHKRFGKYEKTPEMALQYRTPENRRWSRMLFWSVPIALLVVMLLTLLHIRS